jgi:hypothetical protein
LWKTTRPPALELGPPNPREQRLAGGKAALPSLLLVPENGGRVNSLNTFQ